MKTMKKALALMLAFVLVMGTVAVGFDGILALKASARYENPAALDGKLKVDENGNFKILQVADIQDYYSDTNFISYRTVNLIQAAISKENPDLIVLTGDNVTDEEGRKKSSFSGLNENTVENSIKKFVELFDGIPFAVTYGNHDYDGTKVSLKKQQEFYDKYGAIKLRQDGLNITDTSDNSSSKYGTGYIDIYSNDGSTVVQRVIILNSGAYENDGYGRVGVNTATGVNYDYGNVVSAVNYWTSDSSIKCIAFQHIALQEIYPYDSSVTVAPLKLDNTNGILSNPATNKGNAIDTKKFAATLGTTDAYPNEYGALTDCPGCSYGSTIELYNALAKDNVVGIFYGHDHMNSIIGNTTVNGKSLVQGFGGGLRVDGSYVGKRADGKKYDFFQSNPFISCYTVKGTGTNAQTLEETRNLYPYYKIMRDSSELIYSSNQNYISDVRLFASTAESGGSDFDSTTWQDAVNKCLAAGYIPLTENYTTKGDGYNAKGDFNFATHKQGTYYTHAHSVILGYRTTTNPAEAITDIRILTNSGTEAPAIYENQQLSIEINNADATGTSSNYNTYNSKFEKIASGDSPAEVVNFYNANYDFNADYSSYTVRSDGQVKFTQGMTAGGNRYDTWLYYTKDRKAGLPIKSVFVDITDFWNYTNEDSSIERNWSTIKAKFNIDKFTDRYPYTWAQELNDMYDYDRDNTFANVKTSYTYHMSGSSSGDGSNASAWGFIGLERAMPDGNTILAEGVAAVTEVPYAENPGDTKPDAPGSFNTPTIVVPDTVYLTPAASAATFDKYLNNNTSGAAVQGYDDNNGYIYVKYPDATTSNVSVSCNGATVSYGTKVADGDFIKIPINSGTMSSGVTAGSVSTNPLTWTITVDGKTVGTAYTVVYAPYLSPVGAAAKYCKSDGTTLVSKNYLQAVSWWQGVHGIGSIPSTQQNNCSASNDENFSNNHELYPKTSSKYFDPMIQGFESAGNNKTGLQSWLQVAAVSGRDASIRYNYRSGGNKTYYGTMTTAKRALITVDSSRFTNTNQIPNLKAGSYLTDFENVNQHQNYDVSLYNVNGDAVYYDGGSKDDDNFYYSKIDTRHNNYIYDDKQDQYLLKSTTYSSAGYLFNDTVSYSIPSNSNLTKEFAIKTQVEAKRQGTTSQSYSFIALYCPLSITAVNKSTLRSDIFNAMKLYEKADAVNLSYTYNGTTYTINAATLQSKIAAAALELGNPTSQATSNSDLSTYVAAINEAYIFKQNAHDNYDTLKAAYDAYVAYQDYQSYLRSAGIATVTHKSSTNVILDSFSVDYKYASNNGDTVYTYARHYNGYNTLLNQAAWTANAEGKEFTYTYTPTQYTVTFDSKGGSAVSSINNYTVENIGSSYLTIPAAPTLSGATFKGWKVKGVTSGSSTAESNWLVDTIYQPGDVTGYKYGNVTLEAVWDFTLRIDSNGGKTQNNLIYFVNGLSSITESNGAGHTYTASYEDDGEIKISGTATGSGENSLHTTDFCVYLEKGHRYQIFFDSTNGASTDFFITNNNMSANSYTGRLRNESIFTAGSQVDGDNDGEHSLTDSTATTGVYTIRHDEQNKPGDYTVTNLRIVEVTQSIGDDNVIHQENGTTRLIQDPVRDYYTFKGWYTAASEGTVSPNMVNNNNGTYTYTFNSAAQTTYAQWTPIDYTITYNLDGGTNASANPATYNIETATFTLSTPTKTGYTFAGWTLSGATFASGSVLSGASASIVQGSHGNVTAAASWDKIAKDDVFVLDASGSVYLNVLDNDASGATLSGVSNVPTGVTATVENGKIKFTPGSALTDVITFNYTASGSTATVKIIPATSVYYEETSGFVTFNGAWTNDGTAATAIAEARTPGSATYGDLGGVYDNTNSSTFSMGSAKKYTVSMSNINKNGTDNAQFTFTGTGFEVYSVTNNDCGYFEIDVTGTKENEKGEKLVDLALFDNNYYGYSYGKLYLKDGQITHDSTGTPLYKSDKGEVAFEDGRLTATKPSSEAVQASGWTPVNNTETTEGLYQIPVIAVKNLDYDTYTVKITPKYSPVQDMLYRQGSTDYSFWFDSVRIIDPIDPDSITEGSDIYNAYFEDRELNAGSQKIRNILIDKKNAGEVSGEGIGFFTVFDGSNAEAPGVIGTMADIAEYKKVGPNNEVYLEPGKAIGFNITTGSNVIPTKVSVGVKMIKSGTSGKLKVNGSQEINVSIPTELYREITGIEWKMSGDVYTTKSPIIIKNDSVSGVIISLTDIRWSYGKSNVAPAKAPIRFTFDPALVNAYMSQAAEADAIAEQTVEYEGVNIEWNKSEVELGETASLVITTPEEIIKVTVDGEEISNFEILEDGSKRWTYTVDAAALGGVEYDVVLYDKNGYNSKSLPTGVCRIVEPKVDIADAVISWDKSEISLGETATLSVETSQKIFAVTIGEERITEYTIKDGRKVFALSFTPNELGKYKYTVILEEYHGYTSTSVKSDALTVIGYTVSTDDIDIQWKSGTVETGAEAELIIRTPADIVKVIVDGHELTESKTLESGEKQWTYAVTVEQTGELEYSIRFIDENGMESSSVSTGALKVELPQEDPDDDENLTFWQKLIRFFRNLFSKIVTFVKGLVK